MQYHAHSFIRHGWKVSLVGYTGAPCLDILVNDENATIIRFPPALDRFKHFKTLFYLCFVAIKFFWLFFHLSYILLRTVKHPDIILVQNPPSLPSLFCTWVVCSLRRSKMIIDWHNLGFTMFSFSRTHPLSNLLMKVEGFLGRRAYASLCVSNAMRIWLKDTFNVTAQVMYDRPPSFFSQNIDVDEKHALFIKLFPSLKPFLNEAHSRNQGSLFSYFEKSQGEFVMKHPRPALVISSTSYTPDENFELLLDALLLFDKEIAIVNPKHPGIIMIVTGKGPLKDQFELKISQLNFVYVSIATLWLEQSDYPKLLRCADLGVCLHTSTSGIDLPMKIVDMFGSGVPVCAVRFQCIEELVTSKNGFLFDNSIELSGLFLNLFYSFDDKNGANTLKNMAANVYLESWETNWDRSALPVFEHLVFSNSTRHNSFLPISLTFFVLLVVLCLFWLI